LLKCWRPASTQAVRAAGRRHGSDHVQHRSPSAHRQRSSGPGRIEAGELAIRVKAFSISGLIDDLSATMGILVESKGLKLITEIDYRIPEIMQGDPHRYSDPGQFNQ
jgi:hypothetical protein